MKRSLIIPALAAALWLCPRPARAGGDEILSLARSYLDNREYYSAITECMRYRYLYPSDEKYPAVMLLMGEAYYRGGNYYEGVGAMASCHEKFTTTPEGERALLSIGYMRFMTGSPLFAYRAYQEYAYLYPDGKYREEAAVDRCFILALQYDLESAREELGRYDRRYPEGKYMDRVRELRRLIDAEVNRPRKSLTLSVGGSLLLPGFGHFYTGDYGTGALTLLTNAAFIFLSYDGYRDDNQFRMIFFGLTGLTFYQYSLYSAVRNVHQYNSRDDFYRSLRLSARRHF